MTVLRRSNLLRLVVLGAPLVLVAAMILGPLAIMAAVSFWKKTGLTMKPAFTLDAYATFLGGVRFTVFLRSFWMAVSSTVIMLLIAYPVAYAVARKVRPDLTRAVLFLFSVPFLVNYILRTFSWADILGRAGAVNDALTGLGLIDAPLNWLLFSEFAIYLGLVTAYMPFMIFPIWLSLSGIDRRMQEASWMLGEGPMRTFLRVTLPLSLPGVFAAAIFGFVGAFGEFAVSSILGGTGYQLMGNSIVSALNVINYPLAAAMSSFSVLIMFGLLLAWFRLFDLRLFLGKIMGRS
ncbi:ABC transporter permease [Actibacterium sp. MT2.3-13A]|uniref:ABC transporter permease n=1 Tax=Actibacterium sp. MT2.3-13A TaxID=2828332 RepID=UPI001BA737D5|nr:ABC transporter permease [Actibacterium sp. MT2.3-13A]